MGPEWQFLLDTVVRWLPYIGVIILIPVMVAIGRCVFKGSCRNGPVQKLGSQTDEELFMWMETADRKQGGKGTVIKTDILKSAKTNCNNNNYNNNHHKSLPNLQDNNSDDIFRSICLTRDSSGISTVDYVNNNNIKKSKGAIEFDPGLCALCQKVYSEENVARNLPCSHHFHQKCAEEWFAVRGYCPKCIQPSSVSILNS